MQRLRCWIRCIVRATLSCIDHRIELRHSFRCATILADFCLCNRRCFIFNFMHLYYLIFRDYSQSPEAVSIFLMYFMFCSCLTERTNLGTFAIAIYCVRQRNLIDFCFSKIVICCCYCYCCVLFLFSLVQPTLLPRMSTRWSAVWKRLRNRW